MRGEVKFDKLAVEYLQEERYIINDLLLEVNNSFFQIDTVIISQSTIHFLDVKNFEGDFYFESDKFYSMKTGHEYKNPVDQLKRSTLLFRQLLQNLKQNYLVEPLDIFINPEFTLYQAPMKQPIIFPTQVNRFLKDINSTSSKLNDGHRKLAEKLISLHHTKNPFAVIPNYSYEQLRKGIVCPKCFSFSVVAEGRRCVCRDCKYEELAAKTVIRSVKEFKLLFPLRRITTVGVFEWCNGVLSQKQIRCALEKCYRSVGTHQWTYYE